MHFHHQSIRIYAAKLGHHSERTIQSYRFAIQHWILNDTLDELCKFRWITKSLWKRYSFRQKRSHFLRQRRQQRCVKQAYKRVLHLNVTYRRKPGFLQHTYLAQWSPHGYLECSNLWQLAASYRQWRLSKRHRLPVRFDRRTLQPMPY